MENNIHSDHGHWIYAGEISIDTYGFIYSIENIVTGRSYIGKKQMMRTKKLQPLKGKKNKRHFVVQTDWKTYTSSCNELNSDIEKLGKDNFSFTILKLCSCKWELAYWEAKLQFDNNVLLSESYYNGIINLRIGKKPKGGNK